jgi:hypothetical protein
MSRVIELLLAVKETARLVFQEEVVDNQLNPKLLALATICYRIQSAVLRIPDRFGWFYPGLPRLQVFQAYHFVLISTIQAVFFPYGLLTILFFKYLGCPDFRTKALTVLASTASMPFFFWFLFLYHYSRSENYRWPDWKMRKGLFTLYVEKISHLRPRFLTC